MIVSRRFVFAGQVQGVGFRVFTADAARRERLSGHVRNLEDGRVEVVATGEAEALTRFERSLRTGPPLARVDDVAVNDLLPVSAVGFSIRDQ